MLNDKSFVSHRLLYPVKNVLTLIKRCLPTLTLAQHTTTVFNEFIRAITNLPRATKSVLLPTLLEAIHGVTTSDAPAELPVHSTPDPTLAPTEGAPTVIDPHHGPTGNQPATTVDHTTRQAIRDMPRTHLQTTWNKPQLKP